MEKTARETGQYMSKCLKRGIRVYPVPWGRNFKIVVERNGKPKHGEQIFNATTVFDKINEIYKQIANNIEKKQTQLIS